MGDGCMAKERYGFWADFLVILHNNLKKTSAMNSLLRWLSNQKISVIFRENRGVPLHKSREVLKIFQT